LGSLFDYPPLRRLWNQFLHKLDDSNPDFVLLDFNTEYRRENPTGGPVVIDPTKLQGKEKIIALFKSYRGQSDYGGWTESPTEVFFQFMNEVIVEVSNMEKNK